MAGEQPQKAPENAEKQNQPEAKNAPLTPEEGVHASARLEWKDLMSKEGLDRLQKIKDRKKEIDDRQNKLRDEAVNARTKESWVDNAADSGMTDGMAHKKINEKVEEKFGRYKPSFEDLGIGDETNVNVLKQTAKDLIFDYFQKAGRDSDKTTNFAENTLDDKISYFLSNLKQTLDSKKFPFTKPVEVVEAFSTYTKTDIITNGYLQAGKLKEFLQLDQASYTTMLKNFDESLGLKTEKTRLEGEETDLMGKTLSPKELIDRKLITFNKTRITAPKDAKDLDKALQEQIPKALPPIDDADVKQKVVDYLAAEVKKLNPQADEVFELSPEGQWSKIDVPSENQAKDQTKQQVEQQTAETAAQQTEQAGKPFNLADVFKNLGQYLMEFLKWIMSALGIKMGAETANDVTSLLKDWKEIAPEERQQLEQFYKGGKRYFSKMENINKMYQSPDDARRFLQVAKTSTKQNETWSQWIERHLSDTEQNDITYGTTLDAKGVADRLISENGPNDKPAQPLEKDSSQKPSQNPPEQKDGSEKKKVTS